jgi:hypothetical protein
MSQVSILVLQGIVEWYLAAWFVKHVGPLGIFQGPSQAIIYGLAVPAVLAAVLLARWSVSFPREATLLPTAIVASTAMLLDGLALAWFQRPVYGDNSAIVAAGAGWILWGVGISIIIASALSMKRQG